MLTEVEQLKQRMTVNGKFRRGAKSRVSEYLGVTRTTLERWLNGEWKPGEQMLEKIERLAKNKRAHLSAMRPGPKVGMS